MKLLIKSKMAAIGGNLFRMSVDHLCSLLAIYFQKEGWVFSIKLILGYIKIIVRLLIGI